MELWRGLEELEELENDSGRARFAAFQNALWREFPAGASVWEDLDSPVNRRDFLKIMGASFALAGLGACTRMPSEKIIPFVPGIAKHYASSFEFGGYAQGILVESHQGHPTQVQGNPEHPASLGGASIFMQASILSLYDPERSKTVTHEGRISSWEAFEAELRARAPEWLANQGKGLRILTGTVCSPSVAGVMRDFLRIYPRARWHAHETFNRDTQKEAGYRVFGASLLPLYHFGRARSVFSLDDDFLGPGPFQPAYAREFSARRTPGERNRFYMVESSISITGASADPPESMRAGGACAGFGAGDSWSFESCGRSLRVRLISAFAGSKILDRGGRRRSEALSRAESRGRGRAS